MEIVFQLHIKMTIIRLVSHNIYYIWLIRHIKIVIILISTKIGEVNKLSI